MQEWAVAANFTVNEKTSRRILYRRYQNFGTAFWVSMEYFEQKVKLSAWVAPKGLDPDQEGSFWKGNKRSIPIGFAFGPIGGFKKQFTDLLKRLNRVPNNAPAILKSQNDNTPTVSKENFTTGLLVLAIMIFLNGALNIFNGASSMTNQISPAFAKSLLQNGIVDTASVLCSSSVPDC